MTAWIIALFLLAWTGLALLLSELRWFARRPLTDRIRPYVAGGWGREARAGLLSVSSFQEVVGPLAATIGERLSRAFGVHEPLATRLDRFHCALDPTAIRVRQLGWATVGLLVGSAAAGFAGVPAAVGALLVAGTPLLGFLMVEQQVARQ